MSGWARAALWAALLPFVVLTAFSIGEDRYSCDGGDCDLASVNGLAWSFVAGAAYVLIVLCGELAGSHMRRHSAEPATKP